MATNLRNYTVKQLANRADKNLNRLKSLAKNPRRVSGKTPAQQKRTIQAEQNQIAKLLKKRILAEFDKQLERHQKWVAKQKGLRSAKSPQATNATIRALQAKRRKFSAISRLETLLQRWNRVSFPAAPNARKNAKATATKRQTPRQNTNTKQIQTVRRQNAALKKHNQFMQAQVKALRRQVETMERHYGTFNNKIQGEFLTHAERLEKQRKIMNAIRKVIRSKQYSPAQKASRLARQFERLEALNSNSRSTNNVLNWPQANSRQVQQDVNNIMRSSKKLLKAQRKAS